MIPEERKDREQADGKIRRRLCPYHQKKSSATRPRKMFSLEGRRTNFRSRGRERTAMAGPRSRRRLIVECPKGGAISEERRDFGPRVEEKRGADAVPAENSFRSRCMITDDHEGGKIRPPQ